MLPLLLRAAGAVLLTAACLAQARVPLPHGTGTLALPPGWTALGGPDFASEHRAGDPAEEPAKSLLAAAIASVRQQRREQEHVLLHAAGSSPGRLRLVGAWSEHAQASSAALNSAEQLAEYRRTFTARLEQAGRQVEFLDGGPCELFAVRGIALRFGVTSAHLHWTETFHVVPAGERLQCFDTIADAADQDARPAIEAVLRTFDGAREPGADPLLRAMLIGGLAGALAGFLVARGRARRQRLLQQRAGSESGAR
ncbi:MAG: hypothetical protein FJ265_08550 [Planctomycetes bacterium]|nr:hypothetical protein [Planctomycetota bacterium]